MALILDHPLQLAAIDAGSNAFRLLIVSIRSADDWEVVESVRAPIRLGHSAFSNGKFDRKTLSDATAAFRYFRRMMDRHGVTAYRAVATSAAREARNRHVLLDRILREADIRLEVISGEEEARLVRVAVLRKLRGCQHPRFILDLGGGSLEFNELRHGVLQRTVGLPLGTVRLREAFHINGPILEHTAEDIRRHVWSILGTTLLRRPRTSNCLAVACGGNAETLATLAAGPRVGSLSTINPGLLRERLWEMLRMDEPSRVRAYGVRPDRAEVMGTAAIVLVTVARWLRVQSLVAPRVGVREGLLYELAAAQLARPEPTDEQAKHAQIVLASTDSFASRVRCDLQHSRQVRRLALQLFDQLWPYHHMDFSLRTVLESAAVLHDAGSLVNRKAHHRHGEYLIRNGKLPGLRGWEKNMVACLIRYHNGKSEPSMAHKTFAVLDRDRRKATRILSGILRLAERLERDHHQAISGLTIEGGPHAIKIHLDLRDDTRLSLSGVERKARLLERELNIQLSFQRATVARERVA